jgi:predicted transcriptional regulator
MNRKTLSATNRSLPVTFSCPSSLWDKVGAIAQATDRPVSRVVRQFLAEGVERYEQSAERG